MQKIKERKLINAWSNIHFLMYNTINRSLIDIGAAEE